MHIGVGLHIWTMCQNMYVCTQFHFHIQIYIMYIICNVMAFHPSSIIMHIQVLLGNSVTIFICYDASCDSC